MRSYFQGLDTLVENQEVPMNLRVFSNHIYEYRKGLRSLVLHTSPIGLRQNIEERLEREEIEHRIYEISHEKINTFFGDAAFVEVISRIGKGDVREYTPEEDFMLGVLLGYGRRQQCERYLSNTAQEEKNVIPHRRISP